MRRLTLCLALLAIPVAFADEKSKDKTVKVTTKDAKTSAVFPGEPKQTKIGPVVVFQFVTKDGKASFGLSQVVMPNAIDLTDKKLLEKRFEIARDGTFRRSKGKVISCKNDLKLGKLPGYTFDAEVPFGIHRSRMYLSETSFTQVIVVGSKEFVESAESTAFLDSLRIEVADTEETIVTKDGKASAVFPSKPSRKNVGGVIFHLLVFKSRKSSFMFSQSPLSKVIDLSDQALVTKTFETARDGSIRNIKGKLLGSKDIKGEKWPGYTFDADGGSGDIFRSRMFLTGTSIVQIVVGGPKEFVDSPEAKKFFDSLKIKE